MSKNKQNMDRNQERVFVRNKHKDLLFQRVFADKRDMLDLYNALNGTNYTDIDALSIVTLEDAIYMSIKNDLSFIVASTLNLYEHQSTVNPNMPLRGLVYLAKEYRTYYDNSDQSIYSRKLIKLPRPQYIIFYNGTEEQPEEKYLRLSDAFEPAGNGEEPMLECIAKQININYGYNQKLLDTCKRLHDYSYFINEIRANITEGLILSEAISQAMDTCIRKEILVDILSKQRSEVYDMLLTEFDEERYERTLRQDALEDGIEKGENRLNKLIEILLSEGRIEDLRKSTIDKEYRRQLMKEFGLL
ncbi:MAG: hypothetical protein Q4B72_11300 [Lachnospiraceae bacterium]|nr:hypothetical protein [Lachnospiraceae bacterium]